MTATQTTHTQTTEPRSGNERNPKTETQTRHQQNTKPDNNDNNTELDDSKNNNSQPVAWQTNRLPGKPTSEQINCTAPRKPTGLLENHLVSPGKPTFRANQLHSPRKTYWFTGKTSGQPWETNLQSKSTAQPLEHLLDYWKT